MDLTSSLAQALERPSQPRFTLPRGACDAHAHIFGFHSAPVALERKPSLASFAAYRKMLDAVGFERAVLVQPSLYGQDCSVMLEALQSAPLSLRGVAVKDGSLGDVEAAALHDAGIRALRFNDLVKVGGSAGITTKELPRLAPRMREMGWHAQIYATCDRIAEALPAWRKHGVPLVFDHLARVGPPAKALDDPAIRTIISTLRDGDIWIKLTVYRTSGEGVPFDDVRSLHDAMVSANADRLVWGSDWPFLNQKDEAPDTGKLLDVLGAWVGDADLRRKILVENPARLYDFQEL